MSFEMMRRKILTNRRCGKAGQTIYLGKEKRIGARVCFSGKG